MSTDNILDEIPSGEVLPDIRKDRPRKPASSKEPTRSLVRRHSENDVVDGPGEEIANELETPAVEESVLIAPKPVIPKRLNNNLMLDLRQVLLKRNSRDIDTLCDENEDNSNESPKEPERICSVQEKEELVVHIQPQKMPGLMTELRRNIRGRPVTMDLGDLSMLKNVLPVKKSPAPAIPKLVEKDVTDAPAKSIVEAKEKEIVGTTKSKIDLGNEFNTTKLQDTESKNQEPLVEPSIKLVSPTSHSRGIIRTQRVERTKLIESVAKSQINITDSSVFSKKLTVPDPLENKKIFEEKTITEPTKIELKTNFKALEISTDVSNKYVTSSSVLAGQQEKEKDLGVKFTKVVQDAKEIQLTKSSELSYSASAKESKTSVMKIADSTTKEASMTKNKIEDKSTQEKVKISQYIKRDITDTKTVDKEIKKENTIKTVPVVSPEINKVSIHTTFKPEKAVDSKIFSSREMKPYDNLKSIDNQIKTTMAPKVTEQISKSGAHVMNVGNKSGNIPGKINNELQNSTAQISKPMINVHNNKNADSLSVISTKMPETKSATPIKENNISLDKLKLNDKNAIDSNKSAFTSDPDKDAVRKVTNDLMEKQYKLFKKSKDKLSSDKNRTTVDESVSIIFQENTAGISSAKNNLEEITKKYDSKVRITTTGLHKPSSQQEKPNDVQQLSTSQSSSKTEDTGTNAIKTNQVKNLWSNAISGTKEKSTKSAQDKVNSKTRETRQSHNDVSNSADGTSQVAHPLSAGAEPSNFKQSKYLDIMKTSIYSSIAEVTAKTEIDSRKVRLQETVNAANESKDTTPKKSMSEVHKNVILASSTVKLLTLEDKKTNNDDKNIDQKVEAISAGGFMNRSNWITTNSSNHSKENNNTAIAKEAKTISSVEVPSPSEVKIHPRAEKQGIRKTVKEKSSSNVVTTSKFSESVQSKQDKNVDVNSSQISPDIPENLKKTDIISGWTPSTQSGTDSIINKTMQRDRDGSSKSKLEKCPSVGTLDSKNDNFSSVASTKLQNKNSSSANVEKNSMKPIEKSAIEVQPSNLVNRIIAANGKTGAITKSVSSETLNIRKDHSFANSISKSPDHSTIPEKNTITTTAKTKLPNKDEIVEPVSRSATTKKEEFDPFGANRKTNIFRKQSFEITSTRDAFVTEAKISIPEKESNIGIKSRWSSNTKVTDEIKETITSKEVSNQVIQSYGAAPSSEIKRNTFRSSVTPKVTLTNVSPANIEKKTIDTTDKPISLGVTSKFSLETDGKVFRKQSFENTGTRDTIEAEAKISNTEKEPRIGLKSRWNSNTTVSEGTIENMTTTKDVPNQAIKSVNIAPSSEVKRDTIPTSVTPKVSTANIDKNIDSTNKPISLGVTSKSLPQSGDNSSAITSAFSNISGVSKYNALLKNATVLAQLSPDKEDNTNQFTSRTSEGKINMEVKKKLESSATISEEKNTTKLNIFENKIKRPDTLTLQKIETKSTTENKESNTAFLQGNRISKSLFENKGSASTVNVMKTVSPPITSPPKSSTNTPSAQENKITFKPNTSPSSVKSAESPVITPSETKISPASRHESPTFNKMFQTSTFKSPISNLNRSTENLTPIRNDSNMPRHRPQTLSGNEQFSLQKTVTAATALNRPETGPQVPGNAAFFKEWSNKKKIVP